MIAAIWNGDLWAKEKMYFEVVVAVN